MLTERYTLRSARYLAAQMLESVLRPGDTAIDATVGNGHDTLALAQLVGPEGHVIGFDVQEAAIRSATELLSSHGVLDRCRLYQLGHEHMGEVVSSPVQTVCFNLGWLPGGDKQVTTRWETTRQAVETALGLLKSGGVCTVCVYPGHEAGQVELTQLRAWLPTLRPQDYNVLEQCFLNAGEAAPVCFVIQRQ